MKRDARSPEHSLRSVDGAPGELLAMVRSLVLEFVPATSESIRYGMLDYPGLANLAAQKR